MDSTTSTSTYTTTNHKLRSSTSALDAANRHSEPVKIALQTSLYRGDLLFIMSKTNGGERLSYYTVRNTPCLSNLCAYKYVADLANECCLSIRDVARAVGNSQSDKCARCL